MKKFCFLIMGAALVASPAALVAQEGPNRGDVFRTAQKNDERSKFNKYGNDGENRKANDESQNADDEGRNADDDDRKSNRESRRRDRRKKNRNNANRGNDARRDAKSDRNRAEDSRRSAPDKQNKAEQKPEQPKVDERRGTPGQFQRNPSAKGPRTLPMSPDVIRRAQEKRQRDVEEKRQPERAAKPDRRDRDNAESRDRDQRDRNADSERRRADDGSRNGNKRQRGERGDWRKRFGRADRPRDVKDLRRSRRETSSRDGDTTVIQEDERVILRKGNRMVIQQDESQRVRRFAPDARTQKTKRGTKLTVVERPNGVKIITETDDNGHLVRRYREDRNGERHILVDNRHSGRRGRRGIRGRDLAIGAGIGLGVAAGAALLDSFVSVPEPRVRIPRDRYIVDYGDASEEDVYDALSAPPVGDFEERYTLDEIRATQNLRSRMRRVDLDDVNFEFGSWTVDPDEYDKLQRVARAMRRIIRRNRDEVFMIEGHTDAVGTRVDNLSLSDRRAEEVAGILVNEFDVPFENLVTQGYGEDYLKVDTEQAERENRRVAVRRITPLLDRSRKTSKRDDDDDDDDYRR